MTFFITRRKLIKDLLGYTASAYVISKITPIFDSNASSPEIILNSRKKVTPIIPSQGHPAFFPATNNLRRKAGSPFLAKGYYLSIEGYVTDLVDVPIENVIIKFWHANHFGYYQHLVDPEDSTKFDEDFLGCGKSVTDNTGYYSFITIEPGFYGQRTPHIHVSLQYDYYNDGKPIETQIFFPDFQNALDPKYSSLSNEEQELVTCAIESIDPNNPISAQRALFNIKLDLLHPLKRY